MPRFSNSNTTISTSTSQDGIYHTHININTSHSFNRSNLADILLALVIPRAHIHTHTLIQLPWTHPQAHLCYHHLRPSRLQPLHSNNIPYAYVFP